MAEAGECTVCDGGFREAVDTLLYLGRECREVARELQQPAEFENAVRFHLYNRHVRDCTRENYQMMIVTYMQDVKRMWLRELKRSIKDQSTSRLNLCDKGFRWAIEQVARANGFNYHGPIKLGPKTNNLIEALNVFAEEHPDAAKRIKEAGTREKPILVAGPPREVEAKPVPSAADASEPRGTKETDAPQS